MRVYSGNYDDYSEQKQLERKQQSQAYEQFIKEKIRLARVAAEKMQKEKKITQEGRMYKRESNVLNKIKRIGMFARCELLHFSS